MLQVCRTDYTGKGKYRQIADALNHIGEVLNNLVGEDGVEIYAAGNQIRVRAAAGKGGRGGGAFNGTAYRPDGRIVTGLTSASKPWLKMNLSNNVITEEVGPPSQPWGADETWRKKSDFSGAIYF